MSVGVLWTLVMAMVATVVVAESAPEGPIPASNLERSRNPYCAITCLSQPQTMCRFPESGLAPVCDLLPDSEKASHIGPDSKRDILKTHDKIRHDVAQGIYADKGLPAAKSIPPLVWDEELATIAQRWADQCNLGMQDFCPSVSRWPVAQIADTTFSANLSSTNDWCGTVEKWFHRELPNFQQDTLEFSMEFDAMSNEPIGALTQIIWANTTRIGCGYTKTRYDGQAVHSYYCNYGPAGNVMFSNIYEKMTR